MKNHKEPSKPPKTIPPLSFSQICVLGVKSAGQRNGLENIRTRRDWDLPAVSLAERTRRETAGDRSRKEKKSLGNVRLSLLHSGRNVSKSFNGKSERDRLRFEIQLGRWCPEWTCMDVCPRVMTWTMLCGFLFLTWWRNQGRCPLLRKSRFEPLNISVYI